MAVQELGVASGTVDAAVTSCFYQVTMKHLSESSHELCSIQAQRTWKFAI